ncbi:hypothetical protein [Cylindrospermum stagnale]|nr:hypothetical protein [Cylindrospermum stagnale]
MSLPLPAAIGQHRWGDDLTFKTFVFAIAYCDHPMVISQKC